jgi:endonuclease/exonuclease/phosphatase family metal-dependent hydrolase
VGGSKTSGTTIRVGAGWGRAPAVGAPQSVRVVTLNLWGENGPHERRLDLVSDELGRLEADVIMLQEVREVPGRLANQADTLARRFGFQRAFAVGTEWGGGVEGLAVVSRFPIGESDAHRLPHATETEGRIGLSARLETPGGPLWVHTTHLSYRLHEGLEREEQVQALHAEVAVRKDATELPQVLAGDFNTVPEADEIRWLKGLTTLRGRRVFYQDAWAAVHPGEPGTTWARRNPFRAKMTWLPDDRRIDYVFVTAERRDGRGTVRDARVVFDQPDADGVFPSDHFGVVADVQVVATAGAS